MPSDLDLRADRQRAIRALLRRSRVGDQSTLVALLAERGFEATQPSVSRDLRDLGAIKVRGRYTLPEEGHRGVDDALAEVAHLVRGTKPAGPNLTVVVTAIGAAQAVGRALDGAEWEEVVGTVAGDDTIFVATAGAREQQRLLRRLAALQIAREGRTDV